MTARLAAMVFLMALAAAPAAQASSCIPVHGPFDYHGYFPEVELVVSEIATLPDNTTILGGQYHDGAQTVHPALLVKDAGDGEWSRIRLPIGGAAIGHLTTIGSESAWAVIEFRQEGLELAHALLRTRDGGRTWCAVTLSEMTTTLGGMTTLNAVESLRFFDRDHGLIVFNDAPFGRETAVYQTSDGGDTWERLWDANPEPPESIETDFSYPQDRLPPHAPVWRRDADLYRISGLLRVRTEVLSLVIERLDVLEGPDWVEVEHLERYRLTADLAADR